MSEGHFMTVGKKQLQKQFSQTPIFGQKIAGAGQSIVGPRKNSRPRTQHGARFFVGGVSNKISVEVLKAHIQNEMGIEPISVQINKINDYNRSFKVTVKTADTEVFVNPEQWEQNIIIKSFVTRKKTFPDAGSPNASAAATPNNNIQQQNINNQNINNQNQGIINENLMNTAYATSNGLNVC